MPSNLFWNSLFQNAWDRYRSSWKGVLFSQYFSATHHVFVKAKVWIFRWTISTTNRSAICHFQYNIFSDVFLLRHYEDMKHAWRFLWIILYFRQTSILCYEVFERSHTIELSAAQFEKKARWLSWKCFPTN